jgi:hypothetical protein
VLVEPEDLDAVPERSVPDSPVDVGTAHMEAPIDWEVLARLRGLQGEDEPDIVAELAGTFPERRRAGCGAGGAHAQRWLGSMGARGMFDLCAQLEDVGASGHLSQGFELLGRIREELERLARALEAEVSGFR